MSRLRRITGAVGALATMIVVSHWASPAGGYEQMEIAIMRGLDKTTARISTFDAPVNTPVRFKTLEITARTCQKQPPEEPPESAAFLEIAEVRPGEQRVDLFNGWMFASSPALSALEHPVYDVWVIDCKNADISSPDSSG